MRAIQQKANLYGMLCRLHDAGVLTEDECVAKATEFEETGECKIKLGSGTTREDMKRVLGNIGLTPHWDKEE